MVSEGRASQADRLFRPRTAAASPRVSEADTENASTREAEGNSTPRGMPRSNPRESVVNDYDRLLAEEGLILDATELLSELMERQAVTRAELATRLGTTKSYVTQLLAGSRNMTLRTLASAGYVLDAKIQLHAAPTAAATLQPPFFPEASSNVEVAPGASTDVQLGPFVLAQAPPILAPAGLREVPQGSDFGRRALNDDNGEETSPRWDGQFSNREWEHLPDSGASHRPAPGKELTPHSGRTGSGVVTTGQGIAA